MKTPIALGTLTLASLALACGSSETRAVPAVTPHTTPAQSATVAPTAVTAIEEPAPKTKEDALVAKMLTRVSKQRGLAVKRPVAGKKLERAALIGKIRDKVDKEIPPEAVTLEGDTLKLYGFVPVDMDYLDTTMKLLEAQLAGFYEPKDETMYLAGDLDGINGDLTLAHELEHALQDQHYDLKKHSGYRPGHGDEQAAFSGLCEGDATSVMLDMMLHKVSKSKNAFDLDDDALEEQIAGGVEKDPSTKNIPHIMKADLASPYVYGTRFVHALRRTGGWASVNRAFTQPPVTTEQLLHPEKWARNEAAVRVEPPPAPGKDWKRTDDDTSGELGLALGFAEWSTKVEGFRLAEGWGGDRDATYTQGDKLVNIMRVEYDATAPKGAEAAQTRLAQGLPKGTLRDGAFACADRPQLGPLAFAFSGNKLLVIAGPATRGKTWKSAASCKDAAFRAWAKTALQ